MGCRWRAAAAVAAAGLLISLVAASAKYPQEAPGEAARREDEEPMMDRCWVPLNLNSLTTPEREHLMDIRERTLRTLEARGKIGADLMPRAIELPLGHLAHFERTRES